MNSSDPHSGLASRSNSSSPSFGFTTREKSWPYRRQVDRSFWCERFELGDRKERIDALPVGVQVLPMIECFRAGGLPFVDCSDRIGGRRGIRTLDEKEQTGQGSGNFMERGGRFPGQH